VLGSSFVTSRFRTASKRTNRIGACSSLQNVEAWLARWHFTGRCHDARRLAKLAMKSFTSIFQTAADFAAVSPRRLAGITLQLMNADSSVERYHPKTLRNDLEREYASTQIESLAHKLFAALKILFDEGYAFRDFKDTINGDWFVLRSLAKIT
jgi:hypothetical protein